MNRHSYAYTAEKNEYVQYKYIIKMGAICFIAEVLLGWPL